MQTRIAGLLIALALQLPGAALAEPAATLDARGEADGAPQHPRWALWLNTLGGAHSGGGPGGAGSLGVTYRILPWLQPELSVGAGALSAAPVDFFNRIVFGVRLNLPREGVQPYLWLAAPHIHEVSLEKAAADPVGAVLSLSRTVTHRQSLEAGLGINVPFHTGATQGSPGQRWEFSARVTGIGFVDSSGSRGWVAAELGLGLPL